MGMKRTDAVDAVLLPAGFQRKGQRYQCVSGANTRQWLELRQSRHGDKTAAIHFASETESSGDFHLLHCMDVVDVEWLGDCRFAFIYVTVSHAHLGRPEDPEAPWSERALANIPRVAAQSAGPGGMDASPCQSLYVLGAPKAGPLALGDSVVDVIEQYCQSVRSAQEAWDKIRPEYRPLFSVLPGH